MGFATRAAICAGLFLGIHSSAEGREATWAQSHTGKTRYARPADDGMGGIKFDSISVGVGKPNLWHKIVPGRTPTELAFYSRLLGGYVWVASVGIDGALTSLSWTKQFKTTWDLAASGNLISATPDNELVFYERSTGSVGVFSITATGLQSVASGNVGSRWDLMAVASLAVPCNTALTCWSTKQFLALYAKTGKLAFYRLDGSTLGKVAETTAIPQSFDKLLVSDLNHQSLGEELLFYNLDNGKAVVYRVSGSNWTPVQHQDLSAVTTLPPSEDVYLVPGRFIPQASQRGNDLVIFDPRTGTARILACNGAGLLTDLGSQPWDSSWNFVLPVRHATLPRSDLYFHSNQVRILVNFARVGYDQDSGTGLAKFTATGGPDMWSAQAAVDALSKGFRPAGMKFELDQIVDVRSTLLATKPYKAPPASDVAATEKYALQMEEAWKYANWLGQPECLSCVRLYSATCAWGVPPAGTASCDSTAQAAMCAGKCTVFERRSDCYDKCATDALAAANPIPCNSNCAPPLKRMVFIVRPPGTGSASSTFSSFVQTVTSGLSNGYLMVHEPGHYFSFGHSHFDAAPTKLDMRTDAIDHPVSPILDLGSIPVASYFTWLNDPPTAPLASLCDDQVPLPIPDSGNCLVPHGGDGCSKSACYGCVKNAAPDCLDETGKSDPWNAACVDVAKGTCSSSCATGSTYPFNKDRYNPMAYGYGSCTNAIGLLRFSHDQYRAAREHLFRRRVELIQSW